MINYKIKAFVSFVLDRIRKSPRLQKIGKNAAWLFFDQILRMGVSLVVGIWVARYLGPEQYGLLNFALAFLFFFQALAMMGLSEIVVRDIVKNPECANETLGTAFTMQLLGGSISLLLAVMTIFWLRPEDGLVKLMVAVLGFGMILRATEVIKYWFTSQVLSKYTVWVENIAVLALACVKVSLILLSAPLMAFVWVIFAEAIMVAVGLMAVYVWRGGSLFSWQVRLDRAKSLFAESWPMLLSVMAVMVLMRVDQVMLGQLIGNEAVGIYSAAIRISEVWYFIPAVIVASVFPAIIESKKQGEDIYYQRLQKLYDLMVVMAVTIAVVITFVSDWLILLLFGQAYEQAGTVLAIHIWGAIFVFFGAAWGKWMVIEGYQSTMFKMHLLSLAANISLNFILIPKYGAMGAAVATAISYSLGHTVFALFFKNQRKAITMLFRTAFFFRRIMH
ncbi:MAG TPA: flippase [Caldithrix sp.]|nr:flippase [Caldithrix sp.]